jgi:WD40 repeat protein
MRIWDLDAGKELRSIRQKLPYIYNAAALSTDGSLLVLAGQKGGQPIEFTVWDTDKGTEVLSFGKGNANYVTDIAFSQDGKRIATASVIPGTLPGQLAQGQPVRVWDIGTGQELFCLPDESRGARSVALSPDGGRLATSGEDRIVRLWDLETKQQVAAMGPYLCALKSLAFSPDGKRLAAAGAHGLNPTVDEIRIWLVAEVVANQRATNGGK